MKWLIVVLAGCSDRPLPLPERPADLGAAADLAHADLALPSCNPDECVPAGGACTSSADCCSCLCDPSTHACANTVLLDLAVPMPPDLGGCHSGNTCGHLGSCCFTNDDCCSGMCEPQGATGICIEL